MGRYRRGAGSRSGRAKRPLLDMGLRGLVIGMGLFGFSWVLGGMGPMGAAANRYIVGAIDNIQACTAGQDV